jgi:hypothetical protein
MSEEHAITRRAGAVRVARVADFGFAFPRRSSAGRAPLNRTGARISPFGLSVFLFEQTAKPRPVSLFKTVGYPCFISRKKQGSYGVGSSNVPTCLLVTL